MSSSGTAIPDVLPASVLDRGRRSYDVVVVGFGIAGGCAALEAARAGARVLLLERAAVHGGTSSMSGGHFYLGGGTAVQQATGHEDSPDEMYKYLVAVSKEPEHDKIRAYCDGSVEHFDWLEALGFEFERSYYPEKAVIQPGTEGLMFTGNEKVWPFKEQAVPGAARAQGAGAGRHRGHQDGDGPAARAGRGGRRRGPLRDRRDQPRGRPSDGAVVGVAWRSFDEHRRDRRAGRGGRRRRLRDEPRHGRGVHARRSRRSRSRSARRTTTGWASGSARRSAPSSSTWTSRSSPRRSTRRRR